MPETNNISQWFAARIVSSAALITKRLVYNGIHCYRTKFAPGIVFMRCAASYTSELLSEFYGKIYFYFTAVATCFIRPELLEKI